MKKLAKILTVLSLILAVVITAYGTGVSQKITEAYIQKEIKNSNYCTENTDCIIAYFGCPFGCWSYINKKDEDRLNKFVSLYKSTANNMCIYKCGFPDFFDRNPICQQNQCIPSNMETVFDVKNCVDLQNYILGKMALQRAYCEETGKNEVCGELKEKYPEFFFDDKPRESDAHVFAAKDDEAYKKFILVIEKYKKNCVK